MRRFASLGVAAVTTIALAAPVLATAASAAPGHSSSVSAADAAQKPKGKKKLKIKKSADGVQPGIAKLVLTVKGLGKEKGKVKFSIIGNNGVTLKEKAKAKKGKAELLVPALGTGLYKVKAKFGKLKGKTKFEVFDSALTVSTTTLTCSIGTPANRTPLSGTVKYKGGPAQTGYIDFYQDGRIEGGSASPYFLGFDSFDPPGSGAFNSGTDFCTQITSGLGLAGGNLPNFGPGTYNFQAYYTADAGYDDYISSNFLVVTVVP